MGKNKLDQMMRQELEIPRQVEEKMQEAYRTIGADPKAARKRSGIHGRWAAVAAAAMFIAAVPAGVYAANHFYSKTVQKNGNDLTYQFNVDYSMTPNDIEVSAGYIPKGFELKKDGLYAGKIHNDATGEGITIMPYNGANIADFQRFDCFNVESVEKTEIQNLEAHILTMKNMKKVTKDIFLFNEADGYLVGVWTDAESLPEEELKKVAENLKITKLDTQVEYQKVKAEKSGTEGDAASMGGIAIAKDKIHNIGEELKSPYLEKEGGQFAKHDADIRYTVQSVEVKDKLDQKEFPQKNYGQYKEEVLPWLAEDGTLKPHTRYSLKANGGVDNQSAKDVDSKFVVVKMKAQNVKGSLDKTEADPQYGIMTPELAFYEKKADGTLGSMKKEYVTEDGYGLQFMAGYGASFPIYFDRAENLEGIARQKDFCFYTLAEGDTVEYTVVYVADEDLLDNAYVQMYNRNAAGSQTDCAFVKITK